MKRFPEDLQVDAAALYAAALQPQPGPAVKPGDTFRTWDELRGTSGLALTACGNVCHVHPAVGLIWATEGGEGVGPATAATFPVRLLALGRFDGEDLEAPLVAALVAEVERLAQRLRAADADAEGAADERDLLRAQVECFAGGAVANELARLTAEARELRTALGAPIASHGATLGCAPCCGARSQRRRSPRKAPGSAGLTCRPGRC